MECKWNHPSLWGKRQQLINKKVFPFFQLTEQNQSISLLWSQFKKEFIYLPSPFTRSKMRHKVKWAIIKHESTTYFSIRTFHCFILSLFSLRSRKQEEIDNGHYKCLCSLMKSTLQVSLVPFSFSIHNECLSSIPQPSKEKKRLGFT